MKVLFNNNNKLITNNQGKLLVQTHNLVSSYDGVNDYLNCGNNSLYDIRDNLTLEAWIKPNGGGIIFNKENSYEVAVYPDRTLQWAFSNTSPGWRWINIGAVINLGEWNHVAITYAGGIIKSFINGSLVHTYNGSGLISVNAQYNLWMGGRPAVAQWYNGSIDEARIWNIARTDTEILDNYNKRVLPQTGLVGYWRFNDVITGTTCLDYSGNNLNATLTNGAYIGISELVIE